MSYLTAFETDALDGTPDIYQKNAISPRRNQDTRYELGYDHACDYCRLPHMTDCKMSASEPQMVCGPEAQLLLRIPHTLRDWHSTIPEHGRLVR